jgi:hypothetical protein
MDGMAGTIGVWSEGGMAKSGMKDHSSSRWMGLLVCGALQTGHLAFFSSHLTMHYSWYICLHFSWMMRSFS